MSSIVEDVLRITLNDVLSSPLDDDTITAVDISIDTFGMNPHSSFLQQEKVFAKFEIKLYPDVEKLVENNIFAYKLKIYDPETHDSASAPINNLVFSFYDDFPGIMDSGEVNFSDLISRVRSTEVETVSSDLLAGTVYDGSVGGSEFAVSATGFVEYGSPHLIGPESDIVSPEAAVDDFVASSVHMASLGIDPDDAAELSMPEFPLPSNNWSLSASGNELGFADYQKRKESRQATIGDRISLVEDRQFKMEKYFPPVVDRDYSTHEFNALPTERNQSFGQIDLGVQVLVESSYFESCRRVEIPPSLLSAAELVFEFLPIVSNERGEVGSIIDGYDEIAAEPIQKRVSKSTILQNLKSPEVPPTIEVKANRPGFISYAVKRNDLTTESVEVTLSYIDIRTGGVVHGKINSHNFTAIQREVSYGTFRGCTNKLPFIPRLTASVTRPETVSLTTNQTLTPISNDYFVNKYHNAIRIFSFNDTDGIRLEIENNVCIPLVVGVFREDFSMPMKSPNRVKKIAEITNFSEGPRSVLDTSVLPGKTYRYFTRAKVKDVQLPICRVNYEIESSSDEIAHYRRDEDATFYDVSLEKIPSALGHSFVPRASLNSSSFGLIIDGLSAAGISSYFFDDIRGSKQNFEQLVYFIVERLDRGTGNRETIGHCPANTTFTDRTASPLRKYTYIFKMAVVSPTAGLLLSGDASEMRRTIGDTEFNNAVSELGRVYSRNSGIIIDASDVERVSGKDGLLELGLTGYQLYADSGVDLIKISPTITEIGPVYGGVHPALPSFKFSWSMQDEVMSEIDCFYVYCEFQGKQTVIKTVTASQSIGTYFCTDSLYYNEIGLKKYFVRAKYNDNKFGPPSAEIVKNKVASFPAGLVGKVEIVKSSTDPEAHKKVALEELLPPGFPSDGFF